LQNNSIFIELEGSNSLWRNTNLAGKKEIYFQKGRVVTFKSVLKIKGLQGFL